MNRRCLFLLLCVGLLLVGTASAWYDLDWLYRKESTVTNTGAELTDYQLKFTVNRDTGVDSGYTVYVGTKCQDDYDDIRFVASDDTTVLDYWIESSSSATATIWVQVNTIPTGDTSVYLYYGSAGASAVSDGDATFPFFDDFPGSSLDADKWDVVGAGGTVSGSIFTAIPNSESYAGVSTKSTWGANYALRARLKSEHYGVVSQTETFGFDPTQYNRAGAIFCNPSSSIAAKYVTSDASHDNFLSMSGWSAGTYYILDIVRNGTTSVIFQVDDANTVTSSSYISSSSKSVFIESCVVGGKLYCDWVFVRKYAATEPTVSAWGSEETGTLVALYPSFSAVPLSGYVPLLVSFSDASTTENATISAWQWSFGDSTANSTQQNPQHQYTTSGLYDVILTITNTSLSLTNSTAKTDYINVTVNPDAPNADFSVTETCGNIGDTFYFIDFSTGGGLYAWNWSFGDGSYSELRNPTHQYASEGTYDVNLSVWGAYGFDSLLRENLITVPCGAATPTPTLTVTPTGTPTATGPVPTAEVNETDVGETWIRWVWEDPGEPVDIYIDGAKVESWVNNTTQAYRLTGLNPSERHVLSLYRAGNATLIDQQDVTTLPATWLIVSVLAISIFFAVCTIISRDIYRVLLCSTIACVSSGFLAMIGVGHPWGITIIGIIVALITGVIAVIVALDLRNGDDDE